MKRCVVIAPMDAAGARIGEAVARGVRQAGFQVFESPDMRGKSIMSGMIEAIRGASLVVADVTRGNPNVLYEVGFAHASRVPTILLVDTESTSKLPVDLPGQVYTPYSSADLRQLVDTVNKAASRILAGGA